MKTFKAVIDEDTIAMEFDFDQAFYDAVIANCYLFNHVHRGKKVIGYVPYDEYILDWIRNAAGEVFDAAVFDIGDGIEDITTGEDTGELRLF